MSGWRRRVFDSPGLTQAPPGPYLEKLARRWQRKIYVTSAGYDDIGQVLTSKDHLDPGQLRDFVHLGGCLYASDQTSGLIAVAFPGAFQFRGSGKAGQVAANVLDDELRQVVGDTTAIHFDMPAWSVLEQCQGETLVEAARCTPYAGRPLMVEVEHGEGAIFYTSFHNRAQVSRQEQVLLQMLVLKQMSTSSKTTVTQTSQSLGINLAALRKSSRTRG